eukprot:TRINITY_DN12954_c0_g1_i1.p1 TRINITY_DN12954_c0_g1~~TRINITY_DN12954_c0_g1_i1.p1  ORF type:complete len:167 (-),score=28.30 TRINITY_DN12954_c0_g1_i1:139-639(-)
MHQAQLSGGRTMPQGGNQLDFKLPRPPRDRPVTEREAANERMPRRPPVAGRDTSNLDTAVPFGSTRSSNRVGNSFTSEEGTGSRGRSPGKAANIAKTASGGAANRGATGGTDAANRERRSPSGSAKREMRPSQYAVDPVPSWAAIREVKAQALVPASSAMPAQNID